MNTSWFDSSLILSILLVALLCIYILVGLDDLFIDAIAWIKRIRPRFLSPHDVRELRAKPQKNIAIIVPAWDEGAIIKRMLLGNRGTIDYVNYHFFVGCYPNDPETCEALSELESVDGHIHRVENFKDGPTCKGQILNWVVAWILDWEVRHDLKFDAFLMHDSEDLIHRKSLLLLNEELERSDFIQLPVFSLPLHLSEIVAGVYVDEFAESHTKDVLVREYLGGGVPSAGVGTAMSRRFVLSRRDSNEGQIFRDGCLTEDYELGIMAGLDGVPQHFAARWCIDEQTGVRDFIATREYFPKAFRRSVRQKTRWTMGIALQCWRSIGWRGNLAQRYFLYRDRKGLITNPAMILGYAVAIAFVVSALSTDVRPAEHLDPGVMMAVSLVTGFFAINRFAQRVVCVSRVYGWKMSLTIPLRILVGNLVNALAVVNAIHKDLKAQLTNTVVSWSKTHHELPADFGVTSVAVVPVPHVQGQMKEAIR